MSHIRAVKRRGFSLFQLLLLLALLLIGLGLLLPAVRKTRDAAARATDGNNLHQLTLATINCADSNQGKLPPLAGYYPNEKPDTPFNGQGTTFFHILPYLEQDVLYKSSLDEKAAVATYRGDKVSSTVVRTFVSPSDASGGKNSVYEGWLAMTNYAANFQLFGDPTTHSLQGKTLFPASITDGTSQTIMFAQRYQLCKGDPNGWGYDGGTSWTPAFAYLNKGKFQTRPTADACDSSLGQALNLSGMMVGMADGSSRLVSRTVSNSTWWAACTPAENDVLGPDW